MNPFTNETRVRAKFQFHDVVTVSPSLVENAIHDTHTELLRYLDPDVDTDPLPDALVMGETLLAGAQVLRSLAYADAVSQRQLTIGANRIEAGDRFRALLAAASLAEKSGWYVLEPYLTAVPPRQVSAVTNSHDIWGHRAYGDQTQ